MKKALIISLLVAAMGMIAFMGCEKPEQVENPTTTTIASQTTETPATNPQGETTPVTHNTTLSYSGCHSGQRDGYDPIVSTNYENGILQLIVDNFYVNCGMDSITAASEISEQTINININDWGFSANCVCPIDVNYSIDNIKSGNYELIVNRGGLVIYQEEITCE